MPGAAAGALVAAVMCTQRGRRFARLLENQLIPLCTDYSYHLRMRNMARALESEADELSHLASGGWCHRRSPSADHVKLYLLPRAASG